MPKSILITGVNGYIGAHVAKYLLASHNFDIIYGSSFAFDGLSEEIKQVHFPIFNNPNFWQEFKTQYGEVPDVVLHLAVRNGFVHNDLAHIEDLPEHYKFLKSAVDNGVKQIAVMGTMHEIGYFEGKVDENTPTNPSSLYGIAKNSLRQMLFTLQKDYEKTSPFILQWLRGFYITGDDEKNHSIFAKILTAAQNGQKEFPLNSGTNQYDFIDISEMSALIGKIVSQQEIQGIINVGSGKPTALKDKVEQFIKDNNLDLVIKYGAFPDRPYDSPLIYGDTSKLEKLN